MDPLFIRNTFENAISIKKLVWPLLKNEKIHKKGSTKNHGYTIDFQLFYKNPRIYPLFFGADFS